MKALLFALVLLCGAAVAEAGNCCGQQQALVLSDGTVVLPGHNVPGASVLFVNPHAFVQTRTVVKQRRFGRRGGPKTVITIR